MSRLRKVVSYHAAAFVNDLTDSNISKSNSMLLTGYASTNIDHESELQAANRSVHLRRTRSSRVCSDEARREANHDNVVMGNLSIRI